MVGTTTLQDYLADFTPSVQKPIVVVITSYNNQQWYEKNLKSLFSQQYSNYRVIYIDDHSSDNTVACVKSYVTQMNQWHRFTLIENQEWASQMANHIKAVHMCADNEIIVHMDGDDWFAYDGVLKLINKVYSKWDVWITYGQYQSWPQNELGGSRPVPESVIKNNGYREFGFYYSHPRTFYAGLFKKIKLKDLMYKGSFIPTAPCPDFMFMFPMLEMAGTHALFIPDILYRWNRINAVSQHNISVKKDMPPVEKWQKYRPLTNKDNPAAGVRINKKCGLFLCFNDNDQVVYFIEHQLPKVHGVDAIGTGSIASLTDYIKQEMIDYLLIISNPQIILDAIDLTACIYEMEKTGAPLFFLSIGKNDFIPCNEHIPYAPFKGAVMEYRLVPVAMNIYAWQCEYASELCHLDRLYDCILVSKDCMTHFNFFLKDDNGNAYKKYIQQIMRQPREIALLFEQCIVNKIN